MAGKKSQIEMQFNWIFVIIVGGILLLFFGSIVTRQKDVSDTELAVRVTTDLSAILAGASVSTGTFELIDIPKLVINFECDFYSIGAISRQFRDKIVFAPSRIEGDRLITWSLDWNAPFRATNFLLLSTPSMRFIVAGSSPFAQEVYDNMPPKTMVRNRIDVPAFTKDREESYAPAQIINQNNFKVRIIFFENIGSVPASLKAMPEPDLTAIVVKGTSFDYGEIEFYSYDRLTGSFARQPGGQTKYIGRAGLFAAIFTDRASDYNCLMDKAFKKLAAVAKVYAERDHMLLVEHSEETRYAHCGEAYYKLKQDSEAWEIAQEAGRGFTQANLGAISSYMSALSTRNRQALIASCAQLY